MGKENPLQQGVPRQFQTKLIVLMPEQQKIFCRVIAQLKNLEPTRIKNFLYGCQKECSPAGLFRILTSGTKLSTHCSNKVDGNVKKGHSTYHRKHKRNRY